MAAAGIYIRGNNDEQGVVWAAEWKRSAGQSICRRVCRRLGVCGGWASLCGVCNGDLQEEGDEGDGGKKSTFLPNNSTTIYLNEILK